MTLDASQEARLALKCAKQAKEALVRREGIGADLTPNLVFLDFTGHQLGALAVPWDGEEVRDQSLRGMSVATGLTDAAFVMVVMEAFLLMAYGEEAEREADAVQYGDLTRRFAAGDRDVVETLTVTGRGRNGQVLMYSLPYEYHGRTVAWLPDHPSAIDSPAGDDVEPGGEIDHALAVGFQAQEARREQQVPALTLDGIGRCLQWDAMVMTPTPGPARNGPCPCGSGRKAKHCCG